MANTSPTVQWQLVEHTIDLTKREAATPVSLPVGWVPLLAERRANTVVVLLMRQVRE